MEKKLPKKLKIRANSLSNIEDLLQETYRLADEMIVQVQNEINKLANSSKLQDEVMDSRTKYAKAIRDLLDMKDKAISKKIDIAKMLTEIYKHDGDAQKALSNDGIASGTFDFNKIRDIINGNEKQEEITTIKLKK